MYIKLLLMAATWARLLRKRGAPLERPCRLYEPDDSGACTCAATKTSSSGCSRMRTLFGIGTPRALQGTLAAVVAYRCGVSGPRQSRRSGARPVGKHHRRRTDEQVKRVLLKRHLIT